MKSPEELEADMICPFRTDIHYEYASLDGNAVVNELEAAQADAKDGIKQEELILS